MKSSHSSKKVIDSYLDEGYRQFATLGPDHISVNHICKELGYSRSAFYHHFGDLDLFIDELLQKHWDVILAFNEVGKKTCRKLIPDLYDLLGKYQTPIMFNHQLFRNRHIPRFNYLFVKGYNCSSDAFLLQLFADHLGIDFIHKDLHHLWLTLGEAWYSRLDPEDLSPQTLQLHACHILEDIKLLMNSGLYSSLRKAN